MKTKDYLIISLHVLVILAGIFLGGFFGGLLSGASAVIIVFVTVGKIAYLKAMKKIDANTRAMARITEMLRENKI